MCDRIAYVQTMCTAQLCTLHCLATDPVALQQAAHPQAPASPSSASSTSAAASAERSGATLCC